MYIQSNSESLICYMDADAVAITSTIQLFIKKFGVHPISCLVSLFYVCIPNKTKPLGPLSVITFDVKVTHSHIATNFRLLCIR